MSNEVPDLTPQILIQIRDELRRHSEQFVALRAELKTEIGELRVDMKQGLADVNIRIDNLILAAGAGRGDHVDDLQRPKERLLGGLLR